MSADRVIPLCRYSGCMKSYQGATQSTGKAVRDSTARWLARFSMEPRIGTNLDSPSSGESDRVLIRIPAAEERSWRAVSSPPWPSVRSRIRTPTALRSDRGVPHHVLSRRDCRCESRHTRQLRRRRDSQRLQSLSQIGSPPSSLDQSPQEAVPDIEDRIASSASLLPATDAVENRQAIPPPRPWR